MSDDHTTMRRHPLRAYRERNGLSLAAMAARIATAPSTLLRIEAGQNHASYELMTRIFDATAGTVTPNKLVEWSRSVPPQAVTPRGKRRAEDAEAA